MLQNILYLIMIAYFGLLFYKAITNNRGGK